MAVLCPKCGAQYDHTLFAFGRTITCDCGAEVGSDFPCRGRPDPSTKSRPERGEDPVADEVARAADRVAALILNPEIDDWQIDLEIALAREILFQLRPEKLELFELQSIRSPLTPA